MDKNSKQVLFDRVVSEYKGSFKRRILSGVNRYITHSRNKFIENDDINLINNFENYKNNVTELNNILFNRCTCSKTIDNDIIYKLCINIIDVILFIYYGYRIDLENQSIVLTTYDKSYDEIFIEPVSLGIFVNVNDIIAIRSANGSDKIFIKFECSPQRVVNHTPIKKLLDDDNIEKYNLKEACLYVISEDTSGTVFERDRDYKWSRLRQIHQCINSGLYDQALHLALLIPDICARDVFNDYVGSGDEFSRDRYVKWIDDCLYSFNIGEKSKDGEHFDCINGSLIYDLRCNIVHGYKHDINYMPNNKYSFLSKMGYNIVVYFTYEEVSKVYDTYAYTKDGVKQKFLIYYKSIPQLVYQILDSAEYYYENNKTFKAYNDTYVIKSHGGISHDHIYTLT